jgi:hypothetical protein
MSLSVPARRSDPAPGAADAPATGPVRLYLVAGPGAHTALAALLLERVHGFARRTASGRGAACDPEAVRQSVAAQAYAEPATVWEGVRCAAEARWLEAQGYVGVAVAAGPAPGVWSAAAGEAASPRLRAAVRRRTPAAPACGHGPAPVRYLLDLGPDLQTAREHVALLVAVLETLHWLRGVLTPAGE